jgi:O-antigen/teichoic acid export membrane protein
MKNKLLAFVPGISRVISNATPLIILFILSKFVDIEQLGVINYFVSIITLLGVFTDFGLPETVQRFIPQDKTGKIIFPILLFEVGLVLLGGLILVIGDVLLSGRITYHNTLLMFLIVLFSSSNVITLVFNALGKAISASLYFLGSSISFIMLTFFLYFSGLMDVVQAFLVGRLISWIIFTFLPLLDLFRLGFLQMSFKLPRRFFSFALNSFVFVFSYSILNQWDSIIITNTLGEYSNGIYKSVSFIASLPYILSVVLDTKQLPEYSKMLLEKKFTDLKNNFLKTTKLLVGFAVIVTILSIPTAYLGLSLIFNQQIAVEGYIYFPLILFAVCIYVASIPAVNVLQATGNESRVRNLALLQSVGFVAVSSLLLGQFGLMLLPVTLIFLNTTFFFVSFISAKKLNLQAEVK